MAVCKWIWGASSSLGVTYFLIDFLFYLASHSTRWHGLFNYWLLSTEVWFVTFNLGNLWKSLLMHHHCSPNYTSTVLCNDTHFYLQHIKVTCQKYHKLCISNLRIKSNIPSQGYLDVLVIIGSTSKLSKQSNQSHYRKADKPVAS